ncbi:MAG: ATP-binding protein [Gammaproteobacteria bacterium]|nr:ATP-binding protein [Gammaproteobacteria bacterium]
MEKIYRTIKQAINAATTRGKSVLLLGPRQVGKTTLISELAADINISLARPAVRQQYEKDIESFSQEIEFLADKLDHMPLVIVDEVQKIPELMDAIQDLIDNNIAQFILSGSSARKLKSQPQLNWLPGRVVHFNLGPLTIEELPKQYLDLNEMLIYGSLPGIVVDGENEFREQDLDSYVITYLEEEIRQEALVRKLGDFAKFLQLAAAESGQLVNLTNISNNIGVAQTTVAAYYQILEDCLIAERIEPFLQNGSVRRRLTKSCKYLFFDLGVRREAAKEGDKLPDKIMGQLFEQFIGLELLHLARSHSQRIGLNFWRDLEGREVDWVLSITDKIIPIEVKWTTMPNIKDARHLKTFLQDYNLDIGYIVCRCNKPRKIDEQIIALPWQNISELLS